MHVSLRFLLILWLGLVKRVRVFAHDNDDDRKETRRIRISTVKELQEHDEGKTKRLREQVNSLFENLANQKKEMDTLKREYVDKLQDKEAVWQKAMLASGGGNASASLILCTDRLKAARRSLQAHQENARDLYEAAVAAAMAERSALEAAHKRTDAARLTEVHRLVRLRAQLKQHAPQAPPPKRSPQEAASEANEANGTHAAAAALLEERRQSNAASQKAALSVSVAQVRAAKERAAKEASAVAQAQAAKISELEKLAVQLRQEVEQAETEGAFAGAAAGSEEEKRKKETPNAPPDSGESKGAGAGAGDDEGGGGEADRFLSLLLSGVSPGMAAQVERAGRSGQSWWGDDAWAGFALLVPSGFLWGWHALRLHRGRADKDAAKLSLRAHLRLPLHLLPRFLCASYLCLAAASLALKRDALKSPRHQYFQRLLRRGGTVSHHGGHGGVSGGGWRANNWAGVARACRADLCLLFGCYALTLVMAAFATENKQSHGGGGTSRSGAVRTAAKYGSDNNGPEPLSLPSPSKPLPDNFFPGKERRERGYCWSSFTARRAGQLGLIGLVVLRMMTWDGLPWEPRSIEGGALGGGVAACLVYLALATALALAAWLEPFASVKAANSEANMPANSKGVTSSSGGEVAEPPSPPPSLQKLGGASVRQRFQTRGSFSSAISSGSFSSEAALGSLDDDRGGVQLQGAPSSTSPSAQDRQQIASMESTSGAHLGN